VIRIHFYRHTVFGICYPQHPPPVFSFSCGLSAKRNAKAATATLWLQVAISCQQIVSDVPLFALAIGYEFLTGHDEHSPSIKLYDFRSGIV
jgi:hypothetical protein